MERLQKKQSPGTNCLENFEKPKLSVDEILYKEAQNTMQALIKHKKRKLFQEKLSENIRKPKKLWKII